MIEHCPLLLVGGVTFARGATTVELVGRKLTIEQLERGNQAVHVRTDCSILGMPLKFLLEEGRHSGFRNRDPPCQLVDSDGFLVQATPARIPVMLSQCRDNFDTSFPSFGAAFRLAVCGIR